MDLGRVIVPGGRGVYSLTFGTGTLMFFWGSAIWGLSFGGTKCAICSPKFEVGEIIWSSMSLFKPFSWYQFFLNWKADYLGSLKKLP